MMRMVTVGEATVFNCQKKFAAVWMHTRSNFLFVCFFNFKCLNYLKHLYYLKTYHTGCPLKKPTFRELLIAILSEQ